MNLVQKEGSDNLMYNELAEMEQMCMGRMELHGAQRGSYLFIPDGRFIQRTRPV
jgi:hypothetical protein